MTYRVYNIKWDIDDGEASTPSEMIITVPPPICNDIDEREDSISNEITDKTGWCHDGFEYEPQTI